MAFGGVMLVMAFAFAGHYMGQNAVAHNAEPGEMLAPLMSPTSNIIAKGSLMPEGSSLEIVNMTSRRQVVDADGKGDMPLAKPEPQMAKADAEPVIVPASVDLRNPEPEKKKLLAPPPSKVVQGVKPVRKKLASAAPADKAPNSKALLKQRIQRAEMECLARAVYFEARSETELGQLAVAKVILNRVKNPDYPKSICGVVYQGSGRRNSCQFSFACDGLPDDVRSASAWANSKRVAQKAIGGGTSVAAIGTATNYHADYVRPKWAKSMKRLIKIGRHVFYEES
jgi:spore germination cell wall hydrolase CwlJ-like protein